ncbi:solute carrier family 49 member A3-like isoform X1 [Patiria miniata]|nr:solute carrier family 49 member A3-like isoform X1 [Patiria miniata]XP_038064543.1 solute carrier family 49 member A3-like isoform X1 [Patiria miniata]XP_038064549.1 solute carrier family 49 member A3-like isoform X1 [Patiria miniata]
MDDEKLLPDVLDAPVPLISQPLNTRKEMMSSSSGSIATTRSIPAQSQIYKVYKRRWYMLSVLAVLNLSNAIGWITFAPVADLTASYYNTTFANVNWLSLEYMVASIPVGFFSAWILDSFGLRIGLMMGAWLNVVGLAVRYISTIHQLKGQIRFIVLLIGQGIAAMAQPFLLFAPTKLAALWFPESQRAIANTLGSASNPLGILAAFLLSKIIVKEESDLPTMLWIYIIPGGVAAVMMTLGFCRSIPPTPPSASAAESSESFVQGLKKIIRNRAYLLLVLVFGSGLGLFNTISSLVEQVLCSKGYDDSFASLVGALMIGGGIIGAIIAGAYVDKTKKFEPTAKLCFTSAVLGLIAFCSLACYRGLDVYVAVTAGVFGTFGFGAYPVIMELGVETTFPVSEATTTGFLFMAGQVQGILGILLSQFLGRDLSTAQLGYSKCLASVTPQDLTIPLLVFAGYAAFNACIFLLFFRTDYRRLKAEERHAADSILNFSSHSHGTPVTSQGDTTS